MEKIDRDLPFEIASIAHKNSVEKLAVVSSVGADPYSKNYYLRIKGEMEREVMKLNFGRMAIVRPSILLGERQEKRTGEEIGKIFIMVFGIFLTGKLSKYRGIEGSCVAKAMIKVLIKESGTEILESDKMLQISIS